MRSAQRREIIRPPIELLTYSVVDASQAIRVSPAMLRKSIAAGKLRAVRYGRRILIRRGDLEYFVESLPAREVKCGEEGIG